MKNNKGFAPVVLILILVAILIVGGIAYYAGKSFNMPFQNTENNNPLATTSNEIHKYAYVQDNLMGHFEVRFSYPEEYDVNTITNDTSDNFAHSTIINFSDRNHPGKFNGNGSITVQQKDFPANFCTDNKYKEQRANLFRIQWSENWSDSHNIICLQNNPPGYFTIPADFQPVSAFEKNIDPRNNNVSYGGNGKNGKNIQLVMVIGKYLVTINIYADTPENGDAELLKMAKTFSFAPFFTQ